ncbi:MAG: hypothetical protein Q7R43_02505 [Candidatus Daviesbacteria bacterium]|nr:hypothetical protein [Candidatus Daviesbacteria bacterium]
MTQRFLKNNFLVLLSLFIIGFIVHIKSFQMVPYGDDWKFIYNYYTHEEKSLHISNFPGIFAYLAPYGPSILVIGLTYDIFGKAYFMYYLIPLIFKALTAFFLFLFLEDISKANKKNSGVTNFLAATLFMVSITGIQAIDWAMNTNVYIALSFFAVGLFFQNKYYMNSGKSNLILSTLLPVVAILFASTRFTPFVLILPLIDLIMVIYKKNKFFTKMVIMKNIIFAGITFVFFQIGIFGLPGQLNNTSRIQEFINGSTVDLHLSFAVFMHWISVTILPVYPSSGINITAIAGAALIGGIIWAYYKSRNEWLIIGSLIFFTTLGIMWIISPLKPTDSVDRYLVVPFFGLCFLIGLLFIFLKKIKKVLLIAMLFLFLLQIYWVDKIYSNWITNGRGKDFIIPTERIIMNHFPAPITEQKYIFLDFDDGAVQQSVVFGLGFRVALLSGTRNIKLVPNSYDNKDTLISQIKEELLKNQDKEKIIGNVSAFQYKNKVFTDITFIFQEELRKEI